MAQVQVKRLSHKHEQIALYMLANPEAKKGQVAKEFGVTPAWLSVILNTHAFQHYLRELTEGLNSSVVQTLGEKLLGLAEATTDRLIDQVGEMSTRELQDSADLALKATGFGRTGSGGHSDSPHLVQNNYYVAGASEIAAARERIAHTPGEVIDLQPVETPSQEDPS